jgi:hypothetical protein
MVAIPRSRIAFVGALLFVACSPGRGAGGGSGGSDDRYENNDSESSAAELSCGDAVSAVAGDPDWYRFDVSEAGEVSATIVHSDSASLVVTLRGPTGSNIPCVDGDIGAVCRAEEGAVGEYVLSVLPTDDTAVEYTIALTCTGPVGDDDDDVADDDDAMDDDDAVSEPVANPSALIGAVFDTDMSSGTFLQPPAIGSLLQSQLEDVVLLCDLRPGSEFEANDQPGLLFRFAQGVANDGRAQDPCTTTSSLPAAEAGTFDNPDFRAEMDSMTMSGQAVDVQVYDVVMTGTYSADGDEITNGTLEGLIDTRSMAGLVDENDETAVCALVFKTVGVECVRCPDGVDLCLTLEVVGLRSTLRSGWTLTDVDCEDILGDPGCEGDWDDWDSDDNGTYDLCFPDDPGR